MENLTVEQARAKAKAWRMAGVGGLVVALLAVIFSFISFKKAAYYDGLAEQVQAREMAGDSAMRTITPKPVVVPKPAAVPQKPKSGMNEAHGPGFLADVTYSRPCRPGLRDVSGTRNEADPFADLTVCGLLGYERVANMVPDIGANYFWGVSYGATTKSGSWSVALITGTTGSSLPCHTGTFPSLTPSASCSSTYSTIVANEAGSGNQPGYSRQAITWDFGTTRHAKTGNKTFTATGAWTTGVIALVITDGTYVGSILPLSAVRQPAASGDTITVSYDGNF